MSTQALELFVEENYLNATEGYRMGDSGVYSVGDRSRGDVYRYAQKEYGRCQSTVYLDTEKGAKAIGWVFQKRAKYEDCNETFLMETWVTVHTAKPTVTTEYHYL